MALTLGDFVGFETGGLQEITRQTTGSPAAVGSGTVAPRTGTYSLQVPNGAEADIIALGASAGNDNVIGFGLRVTDISPASAYRVWSAQEWDASDTVIRLYVGTDGKLQIWDDGGSSVGTATNALSVNTWHFVEIWWQRSATGSCKVFVDGSEEISVTSQDFIGAGTFDDTDGNYKFGHDTDGTPVGENVYIDDVYWYGGASGTSDFLGTGAEVLGAYQNTAEDATDQGDTLGDGTWADAGDTPGVDETIGLAAGYTDAGAVQGYTICDEGTRSGPSGDSVGTVKGGKWLHRMMRGGGGPNDHYKVYGHNGDTQADTVVLGTVWANFFTILDASDSKVPSDSEYFAQGGGKAAGGREWYAADLWAFLLHVAAGVEPFPPVPGRVHRERRSPLVRM